MQTSLDECWDYGDPAGSEERLRQWLADRAPGSAEEAEARTQVARALVLQRRFADGHAELDLVEPLLSAAPSRVQARYHLERGRTWRDEGHVARALDAFHRALVDADAAHDDRLAIDAAHMLALSVSVRDAEAWVETGIERALGADDRTVRGWAFTLANNHAHRILDDGRPDAALRWFDRAAEIAKEWSRPQLERSIDCGRARSLRLLGRSDESETLARATLAATEPGERVIGFLHEELAELLLHRGDEAGALPHLRVSVQLHEADPWFGPTESARLDRLRRLLRAAEQRALLDGEH